MKKLDVFKKLFLGLYTNITEIKILLGENKISFYGDQAIFDDSLFKIKKKRLDLSLYKIKAKDLNLNQRDLYGSNYQTILFEAKKQYKLEICPKETAFLFVLQNKNNIEDVSLYFATEEIRTPINSLNFSQKFQKTGSILRVQKKEDFLQIHLVDFLSTFNEEAEFIFCKNKTAT